MTWQTVAICFFFQAEDGIRDLVRSRGLGDVYKRQRVQNIGTCTWDSSYQLTPVGGNVPPARMGGRAVPCLLYTSDAADERSSVDLGGRRIIKKKKAKRPLRMQALKSNNV